MSRYRPPTISEIGLPKLLGERYDLFVRCMQLDVSVAETARKIGASRQQTHRYKKVWLQEFK